MSSDARIIQELLDNEITVDLVKLARDMGRRDQAFTIDNPLIITHPIEIRGGGPAWGVRLNRKEGYTGPVLAGVLNQSHIRGTIICQDIPRVLDDRGVARDVSPDHEPLVVFQEAYLSRIDRLAFAYCRAPAAWMIGAPDASPKKYPSALEVHNLIGFYNAADVLASYHLSSSHFHHCNIEKNGGGLYFVGREHSNPDNSLQVDWCRFENNPAGAIVAEGVKNLRGEHNYFYASNVLLDQNCFGCQFPKDEQQAWILSELRDSQPRSWFGRLFC